VIYFRLGNPRRSWITQSRNYFEYTFQNLQFGMNFRIQKYIILDYVFQNVIMHLFF